MYLVLCTYQPHTFHVLRLHSEYKNTLLIVYTLLNLCTSSLYYEYTLFYVCLSRLYSVNILLHVLWLRVVIEVLEHVQVGYTLCSTVHYSRTLCVHITPCTVATLLHVLWLRGNIEVLEHVRQELEGWPLVRIRLPTLQHYLVNIALCRGDFFGMRF